MGLHEGKGLVKEEQMFEKDKVEEDIVEVGDSTMKEREKEREGVRRSRERGKK